jgi:hypothetical protein
VGERVTVFLSPSNRVRVQVYGKAPLDQNDVDWLKFLGQKPNYMNERQAGDTPAEAATAAGGDE